MNGKGPKILIDAPFNPGSTGGAVQLLACLIDAFGKLDDGTEMYTVVASSQEQMDRLKSYIGPNQRLVLGASMSSQCSTISNHNSITFPYLVKQALGPLLPAARYMQRLLSLPPPIVPMRKWPEVPISNGFYESFGCNVIHFPTQSFVLCSLPTIYNPHDLQHLHYPQFFSPEVLAWRETIYPAGCHFARTIVVGSQWVKDDIIRQYRVSPEKVQVIPEGPLTELHAESSPGFLAEVRHRYKLEQPFALYPAVTWPHKNHIRLLEALAYLRDKRGLLIRLVCTGSLYEEFWPHIKQRINDLNLSDQVKFLGYIPDDELRAVYRLSQFLFKPTLFEACSSPIYESWLEGVPVACSNVTALPDQVLDAALLFDPDSVETVANALERMSSDVELQKQLRERGFRRLQDFDWQRTAKAYRAVYRRAAGYPLTDEDRWLLTWDWMAEPQRVKEDHQSGHALVASEATRY
jgi:glycosyltransferase involved in cell wall biosynthesis